MKGPNNPQPQRHPCTFRIYVADNYHYQDRGTEYEIEGAEIYEEAVSKCKEIVDQSLTKESKPGWTAEQIYQQYVIFGEDPYIVGPRGSGDGFSAWDYAKQRAADYVRER